MRTCTDVQASTCVRKCTGTRGVPWGGSAGACEHTQGREPHHFPGDEQAGGSSPFLSVQVLHRTPPCTPALQLLCVVPPQPWGQALKSVEKKPFLPK